MAERPNRRFDTLTPARAAVAVLVVATIGTLILAVNHQSPARDDATVSEAGPPPNENDGSNPDPESIARRRPDEETVERSGTRPPKPFTVVGSTIVDPNGRAFVPVGANVAISAVDYPFVFEGGNGGVNDHTAAIGAWGWNTVRATLRCGDTSGGPSQQEIVDGIDETVRTLTGAGIVVIISCHDATGENPAPGSPLELSVRGFWDQITSAYRDNPYVWFNFLNEPFADNDRAAWAELHRFYLDRYRSAGITNIVVVDLPVFGQAIDEAVSPEIVDTVTGSCNTIVGWHAWGAIDGRQATVADYDAALRAATEAGLAVVVEEAGVPDPADLGTAGNPAWNASGFEAAKAVAEDNGIGMLWWHATGDTSDALFYSLTADHRGFWTASDGKNLTEAGEKFWDFSHLRRPVSSPSTVDVANSACPGS